MRRSGNIDMIRVYDNIETGKPQHITSKANHGRGKITVGDRHIGISAVAMSTNKCVWRSC